MDQYESFQECFGLRDTQLKINDLFWFIYASGKTESPFENIARF